MVARVLRPIGLALMILIGLAVTGAVPPVAAGVQDSCSGDCSGDNNVSVNELVLGVNIALGTASVDVCEAMDRNGSLTVTVEELIQAVNALLHGCPALPAATPTPSAPPTITPTVTATPTMTATPVLVPLGLSAEIQGDHVALRWTPQDPSSPYTHVRLLRRLNVEPASAEDADAAVLLDAAATTYDDPVTGLFPNTAAVPRRYYYALYGCTAAGTCTEPASVSSVIPSLVDVLKVGGYVLHWRHSAATVCVDCSAAGKAANPVVSDWWKSCDATCPAVDMDCTTAGLATARQLDATGVSEATTIGAFFDAQGIPVGRVLSSEYCRCFTTAELMDFGPTIEQRTDITFFVYDEDNRCESTMALVTQAPSAGTNTAIIGHAGFTEACSPFDALAWSEAAIFKPDGQGGTTFVARVLVSDWASL